MTNLLILGASRGLGALFSTTLPRAGDKVWLVSRSQPELAVDDGVETVWIQADLSVRGAGRLSAPNLKGCL